MGHATQVRPIAAPIGIMFMILGVMLGAGPVGAADFDSISNTSSSPVDPRTNAPLPPTNPVPPQPVAVPTATGQAIVPNTGKYPPEIALPPSDGIKTPSQTSGPKKITVDPADAPLRSDQKTPMRHDLPHSTPSTPNGASNSTLTY
jgi:hypothetical protein